MIFAFFCRSNSVRVVYDRKEVKVVKKWKQALLAGLTAGIVFTGGSQSVWADSSDNLMDAILAEETDDGEITAEETTEDFAEDTSYTIDKRIHNRFQLKQQKILRKIPAIVYFVVQI